MYKLDVYMTLFLIYFLCALTAYFAHF